MKDVSFNFVVEDAQTFCMFYGVLGSATALILCTVGAAYGTAKSSVGVCSIAATKPELIVKSLMPVIMSGIIGIYGLVVSVLITNNMKSHKVDYTDFRGYLHLGAGVSVGVSGLMAGIAIGIVGDSGVRGNHLQTSLYIAMILVLIFAEVLGLYGLIVAVVFYTKLQ